MLHIFYKLIVVKQLVNKNTFRVQQFAFPVNIVSMQL